MFLPQVNITSKSGGRSEQSLCKSRVHGNHLGLDFLLKVTTYLTVLVVEEAGVPGENH
jgi:hypothetical protein